MSNNKRALKSGIWYTLSVFLVKGIGFITTPIFTRLLTKAEFGLYNNYASWMSIITIFVTLNLESTLISARFDYEEDFDTYILSMIGLGGLSAVIWSAVIRIFIVPVSSYTHIEPVYLNTMMLYLLFSPPVHMFVARERYLFRYKSSVLVSIVIAVSTALLSVVLVLKFANHLTGRIVGASVPTIILGLVFIIFFVRNGKHIKLVYWKYAIPICLPYIPHLLAGTVLNSTDRIMIERYCGPEDTAVYSLAYTCGTMVTLFVSALNSAFAPWMGEKIHQGQYSEIRRFSNVYISAFVVLAFGIMLIAPSILLILGGESYVDAKYVITPVAMGCVCQFLYTLYVNVEQFKKKTVGMAFATVGAALINYTLNYVFIPRVGYLAAAYTTLAGFLALLVMHIFLVYRIGLGGIYDLKYVLASVVIGIMGMITITYCYRVPSLRICLVVIYCIFICLSCLKNKEKILFYLRMKR